MKFKAGDEFVCDCGKPDCHKYFTVYRVSLTGIIHATSIDGTEDYFGTGAQETLVLRSVYESPLYKALE